MKIAVVGAGGLLGREFTKYKDVVPFTHRDCDITSRFSIQKMLACCPDVVINCAGIVRSKINEVNPFTVIEVNTLAPYLLSVECIKVGARFVHISTDCVFDGKSQSSYDEFSQPTPDDFYAKTKLAGEINNLTIRTSFIGPSGGLLAWAKSAGTVTGYEEEYWNGLSTAYAASWILSIIHNNFKHPLLHLAGPEYSKYDMLRIANKVFGWGLDIKKGPTPDDRKRSRILTSRYLHRIDTPLDFQLDIMK